MRSRVPARAHSLFLKRCLFYLKHMPNAFHRVFAALFEWVRSRDQNDPYEDHDFIFNFAILFNPVQLRNVII